MFSLIVQDWRESENQGNREPGEDGIREWGKQGDGRDGNREPESRGDREGRMQGDGE
jgi:hypothetical protein